MLHHTEEEKYECLHICKKSPLGSIVVAPLFGLKSIASSYLSDILKVTNDF